LKALEARAFYAIISLATIGGMLLNLTSADPIKAFFWSVLINGVIAVPIMGKFTLSRRHTEIG
jgi:hypothetical protein